MDVEQIRAARREMEDSIQTAISEAMSAFHAKTGLSPQSIDVRLEDVTTIYDREKQFAVGYVRANVPL